MFLVSNNFEQFQLPPIFPDILKLYLLRVQDRPDAQGNLRGGESHGAFPQASPAKYD